jgi:hypothetical protein
MMLTPHGIRMKNSHDAVAPDFQAHLYMLTVFLRAQSEGD